MVFSSAVFLFLFLPVVLTLYFLIPKKNLWLQNALLFFCSSFFYFWGEQSGIIIMYLCIFANYIAGLMLTSGVHGLKLEEGETHSLYQKGVLFITLTISLGLLGFYKYTNFAMENLNYVLRFFNHSINVTEYANIALPLGISFYTFHALSYTLDVYFGRLKAEKNLLNFASYVVMFPQLVAGPIVRYKDIYKQFVFRTVTRTGFTNGAQRFITGLAKKVLIANTVAKAADSIFALPVDQISIPLAWLGIIAYTLQIYFDFSGYSDMAIGLGMMLGFRYKENFIVPYISQSIQEFWRRWHISLSSWLRDYVYIPLGGSRTSKVRTLFNLIIIFFLCGLWHGANWTFVVWGLWHGTFLILEHLGLKRILDSFGKIVKHTYVIMVVMVGWVFFRADTLGNAIEYIEIMFGFGQQDVYARSLFEFLQMDVILAIASGCIFATNFVKGIEEVVIAKARQARNFHSVFGLYKSFTLIISLLLFILSIMSLSNGYYNPFIYFRF